MNTSKILFSLFLVLSLLVSCEKDNNHSEDNELATRMNQFIQNNLSTFYLWYDEIPDIKPESEKDPKEYFKALLSSKDKWSLITDDANGLLEEMAGTGETYGYGLAYGRFKDSDKCFAVVQYVYPGSPAAILLILPNNHKKIIHEHIKNSIFFIPCAISFSFL